MMQSDMSNEQCVGSSSATHVKVATKATSNSPIPDDPITVVSYNCGGLGKEFVTPIRVWLGTIPAHTEIIAISELKTSDRSILDRLTTLVEEFFNEPSEPFFNLWTEKASSAIDALEIMNETTHGESNQNARGGIAVLYAKNLWHQANPWPSKEDPNCTSPQD